MADILANANVFEVIVLIPLALAFFVGASLYLAVLALLLLIPLGIVWMPFAAAICGIIARKRGLDPGDGYIKAVLSSSFWLFVPWFYLVSRMCGKPLPHTLVIAAYCVLFLLWAFGTWVPAFVLSGIFFWTDGDPFGPFNKLGEQYELFSAILTSTIAIAVPFATLMLWAILLRQMYRIYRNYRRGGVNASQSASIEPVYLRPFKCTIATFVLTLVAVIYVTTTMY